MAEKVVLAFSGGLDTSCILFWLMEKGYQVVAFIADVGQQDDDLQAIRDKAQDLGCVAVHLVDLREEFLTEYVYPMIQSGAIYEGQYLLGTSIARPCIAKALVKVAEEEDCLVLAHGATGKGNDQVRFELAANALNPNLRIIAPWRDPEFLNRFQGRLDLINYAQEHGIQVDQTPSKSYSMDENLYHTSYESGILEDIEVEAPLDMYRMTVSPEDAPDKKETIELTFNQGIPVKLEVFGDDEKGSVFEQPLELFMELNILGKKHGIGRIDIVENRFVGIKSRGVYETPGGTILVKAHLDLEGLTMDREVRRIRDELSGKYAELVYNGFWFSPEMELLSTVIQKSQELVSGRVRIHLYKGNVIVAGRSAEISLYDKELASMDVEGGYNAGDAEGFIRIHGLRLKAYSNLKTKLI